MKYIIFWKMLCLTSFPTYVTPVSFSKSTYDRVEALQVVDSLNQVTGYVKIDSIPLAFYK
jgi:hypothetical protein